MKNIKNNKLLTEKANNLNLNDNICLKKIIKKSHLLLFFINIYTNFHLRDVLKLLK